MWSDGLHPTCSLIEVVGHACPTGTIGPLSMPTYDPRYLAGIEHFNQCEFFEAHEVWEDLWQDYSGPSRKFYQGLIQIAVCLHHFGNGNIRGAIKLYHGSCGYLEPYLPAHEGIDLVKLLGELEVCCREILASNETFPKLEIVPDLIPEIHLTA
jgi:predicted metal-dependent hydrolase